MNGPAACSGNQINRFGCSCSVEFYRRRARLHAVAPMEMLRRTTGVNQSLQTHLCAPRRPVGVGHGPASGRPSGVVLQRGKRRASARPGAGHRLLSAALPTALLIACTALAGSLSADTYYVSTEGNTENDGSRERPWPTVEHALSQVGGGKTIIVRPGTFRGPIQIARAHAGTAERPTIIQSEVKWGATIIGAPEHVISNSSGCDWLVVDGFEVMGGRYDGIKMNGDHNTVRNCWVHGNKAMGIAMHNRTGGLIENNLIEFNGSHIQFDHGIYASGQRLIVRGNIIRHNASYGLHLYPSIQESLVENNLIHGQVRARGIILACPEGGGRNRVVNNTVVERANPITLWSGDGEIVVNNIFIADHEAVSVDARTRQVVFDHNLCMPQSHAQGSHGLAGDPRFVDPTRGVFWLRANSPAIGAGSTGHAPTRDFWGRSRPKDHPPDLGAFPYVPELERAESRADWDHGWPYHRHGQKQNVLPDLWTLP
jgi:parallel beta-helix repeat protein